MRRGKISLYLHRGIGFKRCTSDELCVRGRHNEEHHRALFVNKDTGRVHGDETRCGARDALFNAEDRESSCSRISLFVRRTKTPHVDMHSHHLHLKVLHGHHANLFLCLFSRPLSSPSLQHLPPFHRTCTHQFGSWVYVVFFRGCKESVPCVFGSPKFFMDPAQQNHLERNVDNLHRPICCPLVRISIPRTRGLRLLLSNQSEPCCISLKHGLCRVAKTVLAPVRSTEQFARLNVSRRRALHVFVVYRMWCSRSRWSAVFNMLILSVFFSYDPIRPLQNSTNSFCDTINPTSFWCSVLPSLLSL